ncbi:hypothetical protein IWW36_003565 [Coemansia brasiliensis]|uniref:Homologous recombination OB-fold protein OB-fold domain-containing protein n=1 Tax=Coemansia brasiliensis TaxID=2650707 RepID=A0A9W8I554_9FUNG|nr:hypothetical protein IWW36_003565 [Coemansia brasiliensis]
MFSSLQDALKKLRESRQNQPSQLKRPALNPNNNTPTKHPQPPVNDFLDAELDDVDLFEGLIEDEDLAEPRSSDTTTAKPTQSMSPPKHKSTSNSHNPPQPVQTTPVNRRNTGGSPSAKQKPALRNELSAGNMAGRGSSGSQTDMFTTPRHGNSNRRIITTTVVGKRNQRTPAFGSERQRIPGPAGLGVSSVAVEASPASPFKLPLARQAHSDQSSNLDFEGGTWAAMLDHLNMPPYTSATAKSVTRTAEAAEWPIRRVLEATHTQRVRIMLVQLRDIGSSDSDAGVTVVDPTGEMHASIHKPVMKRFIHFLSAGTSIILKDVVALKLPGAPPFLTITAASIEQIFTSKGAGTSENPIVLSTTQATAAMSIPPEVSESLADGSPISTSATSQHVSKTNESNHHTPDDPDKELDTFSNDDFLVEDSAFIDLLNSSQ